jgi:hypothetical protein
MNHTIMQITNYLTLKKIAIYHHHHHHHHHYFNDVRIYFTFLKVKTIEFGEIFGFKFS